MKCLLLLSFFIFSSALMAQDAHDINLDDYYAMMGGGGDIGGTGYIATEFNPMKIQAINLIANGEQIVAIGGGGDIGGTGKTIDFIIIEDHLVNIKNLITDAHIKKQIAVELSPDSIEDLEFKTGNVITYTDLQELIPNQREFTIAVPIKDLENLFLTNGEILNHRQFQHASKIDFAQIVSQRQIN